MTGPPSFKTVHASVRPQRIAVLVDKADADWQNTCLRVIEFFSRLWGGAYNLIIPTDGKAIDERFWTILEAFDPDNLYVYRKSGEDIRLNRPDQYQMTLDAHVNSWMTQFGQDDRENADRVKEEIDKDLRNASASAFAIAPELQDEIKIRLAPFYFEQSIVDAGAISAGAQVTFPLASLAKIVVNAEHSDRCAAVNAPATSLPKLWYAAVCGLLSDEAAAEFEAVGIARDLFDFEEDDISQLVEFVVTGQMGGLWTLRPNKRVFVELDGIVPFQLSMLQLGLYRSPKYPYWTEPLVLVAGKTVEDFCLYYCLSRLRERVVWLLPSITDKALGASPGAVSRVELSFISQLRNPRFSQRSQGGLACASYSMTGAELDDVTTWLSSSPLGGLRLQTAHAQDIRHLVRMPLVAVERDNFQRDVPVQLSDDFTISPFGTPKPKNFHTIHPYEHRYITQLSVAGEAPPKHFHLGNWIISDHRLTTQQARVGKDGPAYFCPNIAYFGGDIDTVLVKPNLRLPPLHKILVELARTQGYECRPSDKGIYTDETIAKWGGLDKIAGFLRGEAGKSLLERFMDKSEPEVGKGVYLSDDRRRYLDLPAVKMHVGEAAVDLIDELVSKQILYRGFIFGCSYCRNSTWFSVGEITQEFRCKRCGRGQVYTKAHWKMPDEPAWYYKLDELVYQGYRQGMAVPLLALDYLRSTTSENFSFTTDREFWKPNAAKPEAEVDFFCVTDGVLTIGEAKKEHRLGKSASEENAEISKYKHIVTGLAARRLVFATLAEAWNTNTVERVTSAFRDLRSVQVCFLTAQNLLK